MKSYKDILLSPGSTIREALKVIDNGAIKIGVVVDENEKLVGTVTDGDIRRGILKGKSLDDTIEDIYNRDPLVVGENESKKNIIKICKTKKIYQIPVIDAQNRVVSIEILDELLSPEVHLNQIILMVGGLGSRLRPLTEKTPKPMLRVGDKPILQTIVESFANYGYKNIIMCVNYKSHIIQDYFGDGSKFDVNIEYILEEKRMGTAGALSLLTKKPQEPFFVMNGDLMTNVNFEHLHDFHQNHNSIATMCVREYDFQVPYGVVNINKGKIQSIVEKPVHKFFVNAGIYLLNPECLELIPNDQFYDMPSLFEKHIDTGKSTAAFPLREYWLDIGQIDEYEKANNEYSNFFGKT